MSLIIAYIGKKGCVMASDKRRIGYFGNKEQLNALESELYSGKIKTDEEFKKKADEYGISIKLTEDATKITTVGNCVRGEVTTKKVFETYRKRIYGTTMGYQIVELSGSETVSREAGEKAIIVFGNKFAKQEAEKLINKKWKPSLSLKYMGDIFEEILTEISRKTPTIGNTFDVLIKQPKFNKSEAQRHLNISIDKDIKVLSKFRQKLQEDLIQKNKEIALADKIINKAQTVVDLDGNKIPSKETETETEVLNSKTQAFDGNWKQIAKPNETVFMFSDHNHVELGDKVVIQDEKLCLKKDKSNLKCDIILCSL